MYFTKILEYKIKNLKSLILFPRNNLIFWKLTKKIRQFESGEKKRPIGFSNFLSFSILNNDLFKNKKSNLPVSFLILKWEQLNSKNQMLKKNIVLNIIDQKYLIKSKPSISFKIKNFRKKSFLFVQTEIQKLNSKEKLFVYFFSQISEKVKS